MACRTVVKSLQYALFQNVAFRLSSHTSQMSQRFSTAVSDSPYVIDMRSDVLTKPTEAMKQAMVNATYDDDVYNEDPTVHKLQDTMAELLGMEAALFVPSGTMGNLIAVLCHCNKRGQEVIFGDNSHMIIYEQGGVAQLGGVMPRTIPNNPDGTFDLDKLDSYIRPRTDPHQPQTALVAIENTHNNTGGSVLPLSFLQALREKTKALGIAVHMDGARLLNASVSLGVEPKEILQYVDSVSVCLSKCVGAPVGSVIGGTADLVALSLRLRKVLGGGWRQPGPLAAAALVGLEDYKERLAADHKHANDFAAGVLAEHSDAIKIDNLQSNIVMIQITRPDITAAQFCDRIATVTNDEIAEIKQNVKIISYPVYKNEARIVFCHNITAEDTTLAINKVNYALRKLKE